VIVSNQYSPILTRIEAFFLGQSTYSRVLFAFIAALIAVLYLWPASELPLFDMDEGAYAAVSREMALSGQWWATMLNGDPFFHKPVLMYWLQAIGLSLVGEGVFGYRLPSLVALTIWLWATFKFVRRHLDQETAWYALWIGLFAAGMLVVFKAAIPDAWLILFISLAFYRALDFLATDKMTDLHWAFIWTGFGVLTKGPIALVVVAGTLFIYLLLNRRWLTLKSMILAWKGWLLLLLVALPWYVLQVILFGQEFINEFFGVHNVGRFMNPMEGHSGSPFYYVIALIFLTLPFFPLLVQSILPWYRWSKTSSLWQVMAIWFLLVFVFFTLAATKLPHYLMYGVPPVLLAMAYYARQYGTRWGLGASLLVMAGLFAIMPWLIEWGMATEKNPYLIETFSTATTLVPANYFAWLVLLALVGLVLIVIKLPTLIKIVSAGAVMALVINQSVLQYAATLQQQPIVDAALYVKQHQLQVISYKIEMPSFNIVAQQLTPFRTPQANELAFGKTHDFKQDFKNVEWLWQGRGVAIVRIIEE